MKPALQTTFLPGLIALGATVATALSTASCGSARLSTASATYQESAKPAPRARLHACPAWTRQIGAHISHVSASADARFLLVSTSGEKKPQAALRLFNAAGKRLWSQGLAQPVRAQAIASDGSIAVTSTYDSKLTAFSSAGRKLWEHDHLGRPVVLTKARAVVLFNDDDAEPKTAFISYDLKGRRLGAANFAPDEEEEPLDMFAADDESFALVSTTENRLFAYKIDGTRLWKFSLPGSSISAAGATAPRPRVFVLTSDGSDKRSQLLTGLDATNGDKLWTRSVGAGFESLQIVRSRTSDRVVLYGNTREGQVVAGFDAESGNEAWSYSYPNNASYSSLLINAGDYVTVALDEGKPAGRLRVAALDAEGKALWDASVAASHGLFSYAAAPKRQALFVGAGQPGNGALTLFTLTARTCRD